MPVAAAFGNMYPGALSGVAFALVLIARAPRRVEEIALARVAVWGALGVLSCPEGAAGDVTGGSLGAPHMQR
jgi:hypothetical protein